MRFCIEHHYTDGDVGVSYLDEFLDDAAIPDEVINDWFVQPADESGAKPSHIVIRPDTPEGQRVSDLLMNAANARLIAAASNLLRALIALHSVHRAFSNSCDWGMLDDVARAAAESAIAEALGEQL